MQRGPCLVSGVCVLSGLTWTSVSRAWMAVEQGSTQEPRLHCLTVPRESQRRQRSSPSTHRQLSLHV